MPIKFPPPLPPRCLGLKKNKVGVVFFVRVPLLSGCCFLPNIATRPNPKFNDSSRTTIKYIPNANDKPNPSPDSSDAGFDRGTVHRFWPTTGFLADINHCTQYQP